MVYDTLSVQMDIDEFVLPNHEDFNWSEEHVKSFVTQAFATTDLELESPILFKEFTVSQLLPEKEWSKVAYIESEDGYFFVTEALADHLTAVYSRWD